MAVFKLEFSDENKALAAIMGRALIAYGTKPDEGSVPDETALEQYRASRGEIEQEHPEVLGTHKRFEDYAGDDKPELEPESKPEPKRDLKGVAYNVKYCGDAQKPFYSSGKMEGQWKRRVGVVQSVYDTWYAGELYASSQNAEPEEDKPIDTSEAFAGTTKEKPAGRTFENVGEYMTWVSGLQAAEKITQGDIDSSFKLANVSMPDLFDDKKAPEAIGLLYATIARIAGEQ